MSTTLWAQWGWTDFLQASSSLPHVFLHSPLTSIVQATPQHSHLHLHLSLLGPIVSCHRVDLSYLASPSVPHSHFHLLCSVGSAQKRWHHKPRGCYVTCVRVRFSEEGVVWRKKTSLITLLDLSMFSHNSLPPHTHTHTQSSSHTETFRCTNRRWLPQWDIQYVAGTSCY